MAVNQPLIGFHLRFGTHDLVTPLIDFINLVLVPKGVNFLLLECNTSFQFTSHLDLSEGTLTKTDAKVISDCCKANGIRLVPLFQCLGHQGWGGGRNSILQQYPEFDETPHIPKDAAWPEFFCPSWCPSHPEVNQIAYDLMGELIEAFDADAMHVGMDEVFALADDQCPRCKDKDRVTVFTQAVKDMHHYIVEESGLDMFMWGDRLLDSEGTGYDNAFEADIFGTSGAIDQIPKDIIITDWHYLKHANYPSPEIFMEKGFTVIPACWHDTDAAEQFLLESCHQAKKLGREKQLPGMIVTSWNHWNQAAFHDFKNNQLEGEMQELYETFHLVTNYLNKAVE
jgi:hypothetical protein